MQKALAKFSSETRKLSLIFFYNTKFSGTAGIIKKFKDFWLVTTYFA